MTSIPDLQKGHKPVMLNEVLEHLAPADGEVYIDGTFGGGSYSTAIMDHADCQIYGFDRDDTAIARAGEIKSDPKYAKRLHPIHSCFGDMHAKMVEADMPLVDGIVLDLGVSSFQLDEAERGFSFMRDGPLDMRMGLAEESAADIVNNMDETDLANIIYQYGDEKQSRRIAKAICKARLEAPFETTLQLANLIEKTCPKKGKSRIHPATRTFQALRIYVNKELEEVEKALEASLHLLKPDGRLVIVAFHSLEDRIVKHFMRQYSGNTAKPNKYAPIREPEAIEKSAFTLKKRGAIRPTKEEESENPRSRSAVLRCAIRTAFSLDEIDLPEEVSHKKNKGKGYKK